jgi:glutaredoxin
VEAEVKQFDYSKMKKAKLYRMVTDEHLCPFGMKSLDILKREGYQVDDHQLKDREETDEFKREHDVKTTPQTFIDGKRIGGFDDLQKYFGKKSGQDNSGTDYQPIIAIFSVTFLMALSLTWLMKESIDTVFLIELFVSLSMCVLAIMKLKDLFSFTNQFIAYDLLGMKYVRYAYFYPFAEAFVGLGMIAKVFTFIVSPLAIFIGVIGIVSVIKAVYIDKRKLKCACVGGDSNVPLGFISLTENLFIVGMGVWMLL